MGFNMQKLMKQAQKMQADVAKAQEALGDIVVEGVSGGGMVKVSCNCRQEILSLKINPTVVDAEDVEMLEDLILAAVKEALSISQSKAAAEMQKISGGLGLPPGLF
jgi:DNA-binding YbaB/EbfC family protein